MRLWTYYRPYKAILFSDLGAVVLLAAPAVIVPYFLKVIVDVAMPAQDLGRACAAVWSAVQEALKRLVKGRTTLIIAHRLSTVREVDEIIVLTEEGIGQRRPHTELIAMPGLYWDLCATQQDGGGADLVLADEINADE